MEKFSTETNNTHENQTRADFVDVLADSPDRAALAHCVYERLSSICAGELLTVSDTFTSDDQRTERVIARKDTQLVDVAALSSVSDRECREIVLHYRTDDGVCDIFESVYVREAAFGNGLGIGHKVWLSDYAETGYEGHGYTLLNDCSEMDVARFEKLAHDVFEGKRRFLQCQYQQLLNKQRSSPDRN